MLFRRFYIALGILLMWLLPQNLSFAPDESAGAPADKTQTQTVIALMGDTMLGRLVSDVMEEKPSDYFWGDTLPLVRECDLQMLNLETSITTSDEYWSEWRKAFYYKAIPKAVDVLQAADIDYVSLANNHVLDFSESGLKDTIQYLDEGSILHSGAGFSVEEASKPKILEANGLKIGIFSFADHYSEWDVARRGAGIFYISIPPDKDQWERIERNIKQLKEDCDLVMVSVHWGPNMRTAPSSQVIELAHRLIDAGVDVIHGHSAHVFHGVEIYKGRPILYDTGEYIDDYAVDPQLRNDFSFLYRLHLQGKALDYLELIPVHIDRMQVNLAEKSEQKKIIKMFEMRTKRFDTPYKIEEGRVIVPVNQQ